MSGLTSNNTLSDHVYDFIHNSGWMTQARYTDISISVAGDVVTLTYKEFDAVLGTAVLTFTDADTWSVALSRYISNDDGPALQDDDSTYLNLD